MFISNNNYVCSFSLLEKINERIKELDQPIIWYLQGLSNKIYGDLDNALLIFKKNSAYWKTKNNNYRIIKSLLGEFSIYKNISLIHANEIASQLLNQKIKHSNYSLKSIINHNVGIHYYLQEKYDEAYSLFLENVSLYSRIDDWIFVGILCTLLEKRIPKEIGEIEISSDNPDKYYLQYYKMKACGMNNELLSKHIMKKIIPMHLEKDKYEQPMWEIFRIELYEMLKKSKKYYNTYFEYVEKMEKVCGIAKNEEK